MSDSSTTTAPNANLRPCTRYIIGHNDAAKSIFLPTPDLFYHKRFGYSMTRTYAVPCLPAPLDQDADLKLYLSPNDGTNVTSCSSQSDKVTIDGGVNSVYLDMGPGSQSPMHRTVSIDLVVVIEGEIELELDSGEKKLLYQGNMSRLHGTTGYRGTTGNNASLEKSIKLQAGQDTGCPDV
ncbi:hypothetical protein N7463_003380 [Penicillium fimorum]|uniref:Uncharacterized protein n=1 Tax=Penicillium fimorum TaxID=1882269 RepID=A0A9X0C974_9EURO|nr:hypothetical protein N7463_003380 [Penicillium fimorum]